MSFKLNLQAYTYLKNNVLRSQNCLYQRFILVHEIIISYFVAWNSAYEMYTLTNNLL